MVVAEQGAAFVCGLGLVAGADPASDVRALGAVLHECVSGEPPGTPPRRLEVPGIPSAVAEAVDRATGANGPPFPSIAAFAEALAAAVAPASHAALAAYVDAAVPPDGDARAGPRRALSAALGEEEVVAELVVDLDPVPPPAASRAAVAPSASDAARVFAAPAPRRASARLPVVVGILALAIGFAVGFLAQRLLL